MQGRTGKEFSIAFLVFGIPGLVILLFSYLGWLPVAWLCQVFSEDGRLSERLIFKLAYSQCMLGVLLTLGAGLGGLVLPLGAKIRSGLDALSARTFFCGQFLLALALALTVEWVILDAIPHVTDESSHLFQARIFATGHSYAPRPPCPDHFYQNGIIMTQSGKWFTRYPPGHALLLTPGVWLHLTWMVVPLCLAVSAILFALITERFFGSVIARLSGLLFVFSPMALLLGASYMSHVTWLMCTLTGVWSAGRGVEQNHHPIGTRVWLVFSGFCLGMAAIIRPQDFILTLVAFLLAGIFWPGCCRLFSLWRRAFSMALGFLVPAGILFLWNREFYGSGFSVGYGFADSQSLYPGIQVSYGLSAEFTLAQALRQLVLTLAKANKALLGWPCSFLFMPLCFILGRTDRRDWYCLLTSLLVVIIFFFYDYGGFEYEARFYFAAFPLWIILTVRGAQRAHEFVRRLSTRAGKPVTSDVCMTGLIGVVFAIFFLHAALVYWPISIWPTYTRGYEQATPVVHRLAQAENLKQAIVLIASPSLRDSRYTSGFIFNDPFLTHNIIYARDVPLENDCLRIAFPNRTMYRFMANPAWTDGRFVPLRELPGTVE